MGVLSLALASVGQAAVVVVAHPGVRSLDATQVTRIYMGRMVELDGLALQPLNLPPGHALRQRFLADFLRSDEGRYTAYWTVRRHVGKGVPPLELGSASEVLMRVLATPGALGYAEEADLPPGVNVVARPPAP